MISWAANSRWKKKTLFRIQTCWWGQREFVLCSSTLTRFYTHTFQQSMLFSLNKKVRAVRSRAEDLDLLLCSEEHFFFFHLQDYLSAQMCEACTDFCLLGRKEGFYTEKSNGPNQESNKWIQYAFNTWQRARWITWWIFLWTQQRKKKKMYFVGVERQKCTGSRKGNLLLYPAWLLTQ